MKHFEDFDLFKLNNDDGKWCKGATWTYKKPTLVEGLDLEFPGAIVMLKTKKNSSLYSCTQIESCSNVVASVIPSHFHICGS